MYVTLKCAKNILGISGVSGIGVNIEDVYKAEEVKERLYRKLPKEILIRTYFDLNQNLSLLLSVYPAIFASKITLCDALREE